MKKWIVNIDNDEGILNLPPDLLEESGWKEGDTLDWKDNKDGSFS